MTLDQELPPDDIQTRLLSEEPSERLSMDACKVIEKLRNQIINQRETLDKLPKCWRLASGTLLVQDFAVVPEGVLYFWRNDVVIGGHSGRCFLVKNSEYGHDQWFMATNTGRVALVDCADSPEAAKALAKRATVAQKGPAGETEVAT